MPPGVQQLKLPVSKPPFERVPVTQVLAATPTPVRLAVCGLPGALSVTLSVPVKVPMVSGVKVTLMVQLVLAATEVPQLLVCA